jgi:hypothetical protein
MQSEQGLNGFSFDRIYKIFKGDAFFGRIAFLFFGSLTISAKVSR